MVLYLIRKLKMITIVSKKKCLIKLLIDILRQDRTLETFQYFNKLKIKNCSYKSLKNYILDKGFSFTYPTLLQCYTTQHNFKFFCLTKSFREMYFWKKVYFGNQYNAMDLFPEIAKGLSINDVTHLLLTPPSYQPLSPILRNRRME